MVDTVYLLHNPGDTEDYDTGLWPRRRYGLTGPHNGTVEINYDVYLDDKLNSWKVRVNSCVSAIDTTRRLVPRCSQIIIGLPPMGNTTSKEFCDQVTDLSELGFRFFRWYVIEAVNAHEDVHVQEWKDAWNIEWEDLERTIENLSYPNKEKLDKSDARIILEALVSNELSSALLSAIRAFQATGEEPACLAERPIVNNLIQNICTLARAQEKWPKCETIAPDGRRCNC